MPHVVLKGPITPEDIWIAFQPTEFVEGSSRFKAEDCFLAQDKTVALIRSITVERGFRKIFLVRVSSKEGTVTLSIDPLTPVEKSDGVRRLLGLYALRIMQADPEITVHSTNIPEFLGEPAG